MSRLERIKKILESMERHARALIKHDMAVALSIVICKFSFPRRGHVLTPKATNGLHEVRITVVPHKINPDPPRAYVIFIMYMVATAI